MANPHEQGRSASMPYLALGIGLLTETSFTLGQTPSPTLVAQVTGSVPPSGVLITPPPAPVAVPPSGVVATLDRRAVTTLPFKTAPKLQTTKRATRVPMRRHVMHWRSAARRETITRTTTVDQSIAATPAVVSTPAERPRHDGIGYELFQLCEGKEAK